MAFDIRADGSRTLPDWLRLEEGSDGDPSFIEIEMTEGDFLEPGETTEVELEIILEDVDFQESIEFKIYALP